MMNDEQRRSWSKLTADARNATQPTIDVHRAVMAKIRRSRSLDEAKQSLSLFDAVDALITRRGMRPALVLLVVITCGFAYGAYRGAEIVDLVSALTI